MNNLLGLAISPHPPIIIPEIGGGREREAQDTIDGMRKMAKKVAEKKPELLVVITPHGNVFSDGICILAEEEITGDMGNFGRPQIKLNKTINMDLISKLSETFKEENIPGVFLDQNKGKRYRARVEMDHGAFIPLYYIDQYWEDYELLHVTIGMLSPLELYRIGKVIRETIMELGLKTVFLASGDMSHKLKEEGPYSYNPMGRVFDEKVVEAIAGGDIDAIVNMPKEVYEPAGECGLRPFAMGLGSLDGMVTRSKVFSYEGPFGVGYMTAFVEPTGEGSKSFLEKEIKSLDKKNISKENPFIALARASIEHWIKSGMRLVFADIRNEFQDKDWTKYVENKRAGAFVSIHKDGQLRGCIGTIKPTQANVAEELIRNAIQASSSDSRFNPIEEEELPLLDIKVDILHEIEPIKSLEELDIKKYGVIVEAGYKRGLLLPNLEGVNTVKDQVDIAKRKAGITFREKYKLYRFEVTRYE